MPLYRRLPKRGFNPILRKKIAILNLDKIQSFIDKKSLKSKDIINSELLNGLEAPNQSVSETIKILEKKNLGNKKDRKSVV